MPRSARIALQSRAHEGSSLGDEIAVDGTTHAIFVTNRDVVGALPRVDDHDDATRFVTVQTAESLAIDEHRQVVYLARANEVDVFDTRTLRRIHGAPFETGSYPLAVTVWHPRASANLAVPR